EDGRTSGASHLCLRHLCRCHESVHLSSDCTSRPAHGLAVIHPVDDRVNGGQRSGHGRIDTGAAELLAPLRQCRDMPMVGRRLHSLRSTSMRATILYGPGDVRVEERADPTILEPTDAIIRLSATCVCGSDLWPYRGISPIAEPAPMGHEYCGIVEDVGRAVTSITRGQFVIGSFFASDNTCPHCHAGYQTSCQHKQPVVGAQAPLLRVTLADGTLVPTRDVPANDAIPSLLTLSDVMGTGWFA